VIFLSLSTPVLLKPAASAPQGAVKLKSGSREILKYLHEKIIFYIFDPLKKLNKLATKNTNQWYRQSSIEVPHPFCCDRKFLDFLSISEPHFFLQVQSTLD
jgi:hypothetical protein